MDERQGRGSHAPEAGHEAKAARRRRWLIFAMAAVAGALSVGLALLRGIG